MKIVTWNVNGIRAQKLSLKELLDSFDADLICFQETKITRDQLDLSTAIVDGYSVYYSFSRKRSGYSGVATFCRDKKAHPWCAEEGLSRHLKTTAQSQDDIIGCYGDLTEFSEEELHSLDSEGRAVITQHKFRDKAGCEQTLNVINVYCPRADPERDDRRMYKFRFYALLQTRAEAFLQAGHHVIVLGDMNSIHQKLDHCDPEEEVEFEHRRNGRLWMNQFLWEAGRDPDLISDNDDITVPGTTAQIHGGMFIDTYRHLHAGVIGAYTCWCTLTAARQTNYGRRLDYIFSNVDFVTSFLSESVILSEVDGSDHCPVMAEFSCDLLPSLKYPSLCTKYMPEFSGSQQKLSMYFGKVNVVNEITVNMSKHQAVNGFNNSSDKDKAGNNSQISKSSTDVLKRKLRDEVKSPISKKKAKSMSKGQCTLTGFFSRANSQTKCPETAICISESKGKINSPSLLQDSNSPLQSLSTGQLSLSSSSSHTSVSSVHLSSHSSSSSHTSSSSSSLLSSQKVDAVHAWKSILLGPPPAPLCKGHKEPCVLRTVKKDGPNKGRQFFVCTRPEGHSSNTEARCDHFEWVPKKNK